jgi:chemotaxis protein methyltransferase CheR
MLILLHEKRLLESTQVLATDINTEFMEQVKQGKYNIDLWKKFNENYQSFIKSSQKDLSQYADQKGENFIFKDFLKKNLQVKFHNLTQLPQTQVFNIILCRNVLIYFDDVLKKQVLNLLCDSLETGGYLMLGFYDMLPSNVDIPLKLIDPSLKIFSKI